MAVLITYRTIKIARYKKLQTVIHVEDTSPISTAKSFTQLLLSISVNLGRVVLESSCRDLNDRTCL
jgi:hypothetical protein